MTAAWWRFESATWRVAVRKSFSSIDAHCSFLHSFSIKFLFFFVPHYLQEQPVKAWSITVRTSLMDASDMLDINDDDLLSLNADSIEFFGTTTITAQGARKLVQVFNFRSFFVFFRRFWYVVGHFLRCVKSLFLAWVLSYWSSIKFILLTEDTTHFHAFAWCFILQYLNWKALSYIFGMDDRK